MAGSIHVVLTGQQQLIAVGKALRESGNKDLKKELMKAAQRTARPIRKEMRASALRSLPKSGGLNVWVASKLSIRIKLRLAGRNAGINVRLRRPNPNAASGQSDINAINRGRVRHPTYAHSPWVVDVFGPPYAFWAFRVMEGTVARRARHEFRSVLDHIARRIQRAA